MSNDVEEIPPQLYGELRRLARRALRRERPGHTLQPTALAHEAYARLARDASFTLRDRKQFGLAAARAMRRILIEYARARSAAKRQSSRIVPLAEEPLAPEQDEYVLALHEALERLHQQDEQLARIVELRFFGGYSVPEVAEMIGVSERTVKRGWSVAKGWLHREITEGESRAG